MRILIIEDDKVVSRTLIKGLTKKGFHTDCVHDGKSGLKLAREGNYDVLIIDRMLPKLYGLAIIKTLRAEGNETPILTLTALNEVEDTIKGLVAGADDYMGKPFVFAELLARVRALARRKSFGTEKQSTLTVHDLIIDKINRRVTRGHKEISLQPKEFDVLAFMMIHIDETVTRTMLLEHVWGVSFDPQTNIVDVHISRLRRKLDTGFRNPIISTIRGIGYSIESKH